jgi:hypothetical protein
LPMSWIRLCLPLVLLVLSPPSPVLAQKNLGFDNTKPSGQPYLPPEESLRRLRVPPGWEVKLFAAEPDVVNPIAFTVDERGRLWVVECYEYPKRTAKGAKPRDRIKILEDTTGAGRADKVTVWAEGKDLPISWDLASGIEVGHGGVFLGAAPHLFFLRDTQGAGRCDRQEILLSGFGSQDTHETLNTLQWGPDGLLYGLHGIFTQSQIGEVQMNAAVWRYDPSPLPLSPGGRGETAGALAPRGRGVGVRVLRRPLARSPATPAAWTTTTCCATASNDCSPGSRTSGPAAAAAPSWTPPRSWSATSPAGPVWAGSARTPCS